VRREEGGEGQSIGEKERGGEGSLEL